MAKVIFEFDDNEESNEVNIVANRHKLVCAVNELSDLHRRIYNGKLYEDESIYVLKEGRVATQEDYDKANKEGKFLEGGKTYLDSNFIEGALDRILEDVRGFIY